jgi:hypothetical protein
LHSFVVLCETNILSLINQYLDNYYQIKTKLLQCDMTFTKLYDLNQTYAEFALGHQMSDSVASFPGRCSAGRNPKTLTISIPAVIAEIRQSPPATHSRNSPALNRDLGALRGFKSQDAAGAAARTTYVAASPPPLPPRRRVSIPSTPHSSYYLLRRQLFAPPH